MFKNVQSDSIYSVWVYVLCMCENSPGNEKQESLSLSLWVEKGGAQQGSDAVIPVGSYGEGYSISTVL